MGTALSQIIDNERGSYRSKEKCSGHIPLVFPCPWSVIDCGDPGEPVNGDSTFTATTYGNDVMHTCGVRYTLVGAQQRSCQANSYWSLSLPECRCEWPHKLPFLSLCSLFSCFLSSELKLWLDSCQPYCHTVCFHREVKDASLLEYFKLAYMHTQVFFLLLVFHEQRASDHFIILLQSASSWRRPLLWLLTIFMRQVCGNFRSV